MRVDFPQFEAANENAGSAQAATVYALIVEPIVRLLTLLKGQS